MFVENKVTPPGCNPIRPCGRMPVLSVISGDTWEIRAAVFAADGGPASPVNSHVEFVLAENQFSPPLWTGSWYSGVIPYENRSGFVRILVPRDVTKTLRRGSYQFSLRVSDRIRQNYSTQLVGNFLVEYAPTSDQHSIPYRDGTSDIFKSGESGPHAEPCEKPDAPARSSWAQDESDGTFYKIVAVRDRDTGEITLGIRQDGITS